MPVPTENHYNIKRLNVVFAVSSVLLLASMLWMLWHDYDRPWRLTQTEYFNLRSAMAHFEVVAYDSPVERETLRRLEAAVDAAEAELSTPRTRARAADLQQEEERLSGALQDASLSYGNVNAQLQVLAFTYEEARTLHGDAAPETVARKKEHEDLKQQVAALKQRQDELEDQLRQKKAEVKRFYGRRDATRKALATYEKGKLDALKRDEMYGPGFQRMAINFPGLDFAAPKGVAGRQEIRQVFMNAIRFDFNFVDSYVTDRCITCHVGIDEPSLTAENFVATVRDVLSTERAVEVLRGRHDAALQDSGPWERMSPAQQEAHLQDLLAAVNTYLVDEGRPAIEFPSVLRAHPELDLYVSPDSPHPMKTMGCTVCHEGSGQDTDFVLAAHTPKSPEEMEAWEHKYYDKEWGIPKATFHLVEEFWERPMLLPDYTSASCRKCHDRSFDLERHRVDPLESARHLVKGRELFTSVGCINCHNVDGLSEARRVGTDLTHVAEKLSLGFMERWIEYPNNFRPSTRMPHFFKQENNLDVSRNDYDLHPGLRTETEIQAITHYLRTFSTPYEPEPLPEGITGDPARGETSFVSIGCLACHANLDARDPRDDLGRSFGERWLVEDLIRADGLSPEEARQHFDMDWSKNDRVREAMRRFTPERREAALEARNLAELEAARRGEDPEEDRYVPPAMTRFAPELSGIGTKLVGDSNDAAQIASGRSWLYNWLREPRHYHGTTKMPRMFREADNAQLDAAKRRLATDQDIVDITEYLLSLRNDQFNARPFVDDEFHNEKRRELIRMMLSGQNTESVTEMILADEKFDPGASYGELTKAIITQTQGSFGGGEEGKAQAAAMIAAKSGGLEDRQKLFLGMKLIGHYGCHSCHRISGFEGATRPGTDMTLWAQKFKSQLDFAFYSPAFEEELKEQPEVFGNLYIDAPEYRHLVRDAGGNVPHEILHNHGAFAYHKVRNPRLWDRGKIKRPYEKLKMPNYFFTEEEARALVTFLLSRRDANVLEEVQIPYETSPIGKIADGRALVRELNCIGCHAIEAGAANIHQYYTEDPSVDDAFPFGSRFKPPLLWGEGAKVQYAWLFRFLNNVESLRPWLNVRMPSFHLTHRDTTTLVEYFAGLSQYESDLLREHLDPVARHLQELHAHGEGGDADTLATDNAWFLDNAFSAEAGFLEQHGLARRQVRPFDFDASYAGNDAEVAETLAPTYQKLMQRAGFLAGLFDVEYPFADPSIHRADEERFKLGEDLFYYQKCLACHVAGDPSVEGTTTIIKAPNFALTHERLQYDWVLKWLQDPQAIQPGANMPQIFQDGSAFASLPQAQREELEARFGQDLDDQAELLVDFLFELGRRRHTAIQPGGLGEPEGEPAADEATGEEELEDEFEDEFGEEGGSDAVEEEFDDVFEP